MYADATQTPYPDSCRADVVLVRATAIKLRTTMSYSEIDVLFGRCVNGTERYSCPIAGPGRSSGGGWDGALWHQRGRNLWCAGAAVTCAGQGDRQRSCACRTALELRNSRGAHSCQYDRRS